MTTTSDLRRTVLDVLGTIAPEVDTDALDPHTDLRVAFELDSFDFLNVLVELSERTGVEIPESDYDQVSTLDGCVAYIESRRTADAAG